MSFVKVTNRMWQTKYCFILKFTDFLLRAQLKKWTLFSSTSNRKTSNISIIFTKVWGLPKWWSMPYWYYARSSYFFKSQIAQISDYFLSIKYKNVIIHEQWPMTWWDLFNFNLVVEIMIQIRMCIRLDQVSISCFYG